MNLSLRVRHLVYGTSGKGDIFDGKAFGDSIWPLPFGGSTRTYARVSKNTFSLSIERTSLSIIVLTLLQKSILMSLCRKQSLPYTCNPAPMNLITLHHFSRVDKHDRCDALPFMKIPSRTPPFSNNSFTNSQKSEQSQ